MQRSSKNRHYGMDWLRIGAFQLLILYHIGMTFVPWDYHVKLAQLDWVSVLMQLTSPWRLALLFVVSGYASAALLARSESAGAFFKQRLLRLGLPLLFGILVIVPVQPWVQIVTQRGYAGDFWTFLTQDYFSFRTLDSVPLPNWMHLWFVVYLLLYTAVLAAGQTLPAKWKRALFRAGERLFAGPQLLIVGIFFVFWVRGRLIPGWEDAHDPLIDWSAHAHYGGMFLFGVLLRNSDRLMASMVRAWKPAAALAIGGYAVLATLELIHPGPEPLPDALRPLLWTARAIESFGATVALIGIAETYANRDHRWRHTLAEAVFPFYLVHQTVIVLLGYALIGTGLNLFVAFLIMVAGTIAGCWAFYLIGRRIDWLRPLIGLKRIGKRGLELRAAPA
ncbi:hypothetical protein FHS31_000007 [Sphingomonas vulcanisoli]|uniref:Acyltransferase 3 domain-containing protein n=1 Tax=Sphingomonas vulcanisoli TaxID=1658060 RepID=A0ABX0TP77_9SPHN|nr:acyltransferase [Sphingomonas vulcanisoli]NIJ06425.1 hypothetical protein [Sphingomonas vulcanisoli]